MYKRHIFVLNDYCTWNDFKSKTQHNKIKVKKEVIHNFLPRSAILFRKFVFEYIILLERERKIFFTVNCMVALNTALLAKFSGDHENLLMMKIKLGSQWKWI